MTRLSGGLAVLLAVLLGAFAALGFAPFHLTPALIVATTGLVWLLDGSRTKARWGRSMFFRGWAFGYGFFLVSMYWTVSPFLVDPAQHAAYIWMPLVLLPGGMALIWGAATLLAGAFWSASPSRIFMFAVFMALGELIRGYLFGGFPWNTFGTTWTPGGALSQAASLGGIYWLTLLTLFACAAPAALVDTRETRGVVGRAFPVTMAVILAGFGWAWGAQRLATPSQMSDQQVVLMDAGVPQAEKYDGAANLLLSRYISFLETVESSENDIVIWPEGALPFDLLANNYALDALSGVLGNRTLIAGSTRRGHEEGDTVFYNSLAVLRMDEGSSDLVGLYDKHRLVPFGELAAVDIVPFGESISGLLPDAMQQLAVSGYTPGSEPTVLFPRDVPPFVALICYEALFPNMVRNARPQREDAQWIVTISNDAWFGKGMGPAQHYAQNRYRSIESGLPMARVASRGTTAVIDGYGRETARGERRSGDPDGWVSSVVRTSLPEPVRETGYQRYGAALLWLTLAGLTVLAFFTWRR
jgi:apolipoprotein N-acyltransferase